MRVRGFTQDDAHIFCRPEQVEDEVGGVLELTFELMEAFGFSDYSIALSTRPEKYVGDLEMWEHATSSLQGALEARGLPFTVDDGGGAFYGPKIDINITDALGTSLAMHHRPVRLQSAGGASTSPTRTTREAAAAPTWFHRAILGSMERFLGVLIEHYGGAFPAWLAPVQAVVIPIADRHAEYAENVLINALSEAGFRSEVDSRNERMNQKIRTAQLQKVPYMLVVGDREAEAGAVAVRRPRRAATWGRCRWRGLQNCWLRKLKRGFTV